MIDHLWRTRAGRDVDAKPGAEEVWNVNRGASVASTRRTPTSCSLLCAGWLRVSPDVNRTGERHRGSRKGHRVLGRSRFNRLVDP